MKVHVISDLHLLGNEPGGDDAVARMARHLEDTIPPEDVLLVLGDLGHGDRGIAQCLSLFGGVKGRRLCVLGNHDLWDRSEATPQRYLRLQQQVLPSFGFHPLDLEPCVHGGVGFVGGIGWYDYSLARGKFSHEALASKVYPGNPRYGWGDRVYVDWEASDEAVVESQVAKVESQLRQLDGVGRIVVGLHHLPIRKLLVGPSWLVPRSWRFMNAFLGSARFGTLLSEFAPRIARVFCGHVHHEKHVHDQGVGYSSLGGDYRKKQIVVYNPETDARRMLWW